MRRLMQMGCVVLAINWLLLACGSAQGALVFLSGQVVGIDDVTIVGEGTRDIVFDHGTLIQVNSNVPSGFPALPYADSLAQAVANAISDAFNGPSPPPPILPASPPSIGSFFESITSVNTVTVPATGGSVQSYVVAFSTNTWIVSPQSYDGTQAALLAFFAGGDFFETTSSPIPEPATGLILLGCAISGAFSLRRRKS